MFSFSRGWERRTGLLLTSENLSALSIESKIVSRQVLFWPGLAIVRATARTKVEHAAGTDGKNSQNFQPLSTRNSNSPVNIGVFRAGAERRLYSSKRSRQGWRGGLIKQAGEMANGQSGTKNRLSCSGVRPGEYRSLSEPMIFFSA